MEYINKTKDIDMSNELNKLLKYIPENSTILDLGFGSARDSLLLKSLMNLLYKDEFYYNKSN